MSSRTDQPARLSALWSCTAVAGIVVLAAALYVPFLGNPMVFDDLPFFYRGGFAQVATTPLGIGLRHPPYFTLAFPQVMWGHFPPWNHAELHRIISLAFHIACALALYKLILDFGAAVRPTPRAASLHGAQVGAHVPAFLCAALFVIHPVAVYGAGYLVQRSIVMATLFSLLSAIYFVRGAMHGKYSDAICAGALYSIAVFSKEHSILLPAAVVLAAPLLITDRRFMIRYGATYLFTCLPAAVTVFLLVRWVVGSGYEPAFEQLVAEMDGIPVLDMPGGAWLVSAVTQMGLFFRYVITWLGPSTSMMSIDVRIDFSQTWTPLWIIAKTGAFAAFGALGLWLLTRAGRPGLFGFGMLYVWILFTVELTSVRFQEPFVLYRSYLWAPGLLIAVAAVLVATPRRVAFALFAAVAPILLFQAHGRLQTFSSNLALWEDAAAKLPATPVPLGARVLFGLAREQVYAGRLKQAAQTADRCIDLYPNTWHCNFSRGAVYAQLGNYAEALHFLDRALTYRPDYGLIHTHRGVALERLGRIEDARSAYRRASDLGFIGGDFRLGLLDDPGTSGQRILYDARRSRN